jgi:hypothetical protein
MEWMATATTVFLFLDGEIAADNPYDISDDVSRIFDYFCNELLIGFGVTLLQAVVENPQPNNLQFMA